MSAEYKKDEEAIFYAALEIKSPTEREAYIKAACGDDAELLDRVRALLTVNAMCEFSDSNQFIKV